MSPEAATVAGRLQYISKETETDGICVNVTVVGTLQYSSICTPLIPVCNSSNAKNVSGSSVLELLLSL